MSWAELLRKSTEYARKAAEELAAALKHAQGQARPSLEPAPARYRNRRPSLPPQRAFSTCRELNEAREFGNINLCALVGGRANVASSGGNTSSGNTSSGNTSSRNTRHYSFFDRHVRFASTWSNPHNPDYSFEAFEKIDHWLLKFERGSPSEGSPLSRLRKWMSDLHDWHKHCHQEFHRKYDPHHEHDPFIIMYATFKGLQGSDKGVPDWLLRLRSKHGSACVAGECSCWQRWHNRWHEQHRRGWDRAGRRGRSRRGKLPLFFLVKGCPLLLLWMRMMLRTRESFVESARVESSVLQRYRWTPKLLPAMLMTFQRCFVGTGSPSDILLLSYSPHYGSRLGRDAPKRPKRAARPLQLARLAAGDGSGGGCDWKARIARCYPQPPLCTAAAPGAGDSSSVGERILASAAYAFKVEPEDHRETAGWQSASWESTSLQSASLQSASLQSASLQSASLQSASLQSASWQSSSWESTFETSTVPSRTRENSAAVDFLVLPRPAFPDISELTDSTMATLRDTINSQIANLQGVLADIDRIAELGELPVSLERNGSVLRVHFPNSDVDRVTTLADDKGIRTGEIVEMSASSSPASSSSSVPPYATSGSTSSLDDRSLDEFAPPPEPSAESMDDLWSLLNSLPPALTEDITASSAEFTPASLITL